MTLFENTEVCGEQGGHTQLHDNFLRKSGQRNHPFSTLNFYSSTVEYMGVLSTSVCFTLSKAGCTCVVVFLLVCRSGNQLQLITS